jgi:hypothetical protein
MKPTQRNRTVIVILICIAFAVGGIVFYKNWKYIKEIPEETITEGKTEKEKEEKNSQNVVEIPSVNTEAPAEIKIPEAKKPAEEENPETETEVAAKEIQETTIQENSAEQKELPNISIPFTKSLFNRADLSVNNFPSGKVYYNSTNGKIESVVSIKEDNKLYEYLTSYDSKGNKVDYLEIGYIEENSVKKKYAILSQNRISTVTRTLNEKNQEEELVVNYSITPDLKFVKGKTYRKVL